MNHQPKTVRIEDVSRENLRAWADAGIITHARYVEEIERREATPEQARQSPAAQQ